jgi:hypothetical protein
MRRGRITFRRMRLRFGLRRYRYWGPGMGMFMPRMWGPMFWWPRMFLMGSFLFFLFGSRPYKVRRNRVTVIEREAGKPATELTEEELVAAMKRLGIRKLEITPEEREAIERA